MRRASLPAVVALLLCTATSCGASDGAPSVVPEPLPCAGPSFEGSPLSIRCGALADAQGREVRLHGVNARVEGVFDVALDGGRTPLEPIPPFGPDDARRMRALGLNALRLPIQWSGVEPSESGGFDDAYLARVQAAVDVAHAADLLVLVDFHQDAYSKEIGEDGAPYWATVPAPVKLEGPLDDLEKRRLSKPVLDAFETFFGASPDGARLRGRFAQMVAHVAARFSEHPAVIGFELFNEPIATPAQLRAFHVEVLAALRAAAPRKLAFFEPLAIRNFLDSAEITDAPLGPGTAYSPHIYTTAFGSAEARAAVTEDSLRRSYENARAEADAWQAPLVVTELGFPPSDPRFSEYMGWHGALADELGASTFFWVWKEMTQGSWGVYDYDAAMRPVERAPVVAALSRVQLDACAGRVVLFERLGSATLRVTFEGTEGTREHRLSVGDGFTALGATCDGASAAIVAATPTITVTCGGPGRHVLELRARRGDR